MTEKVRLGDVCEVQRGISWERGREAETGTPVLTIPNIQQRLDLSKLTHLAEVSSREARKARVLAGHTVLVGSNGNQDRIGDSLYFANDTPFLFASFLMGVRPLDSEYLIPHYLHYFLKSPAFYEQIRGTTVGSTSLSNLRVTALRDVELDLPPRPIQRKIAAVLAAYDELIENNLRRIEILEEMAQAVYGEWFVNFRYPGHEGVEMVDSPTGPIPEGWPVGVLGDLAASHRVHLSPSSFPAERFNHFSFAAFDGEQLPVVEVGSDLRSGKLLITERSVLLATLNPRIPRVWLADPPIGGRSLASSEFIVLRPQGEVPIEFLYAVVRDSEFAAGLTAMAGGTSTSHQRLRLDDLMSVPIPRAPSVVLRAFEAAASPIHRLSTNLRLQNTNLRATRDLLLPRLVSGELDVSDLDIDTDWLVA